MAQDLKQPQDILPAAAAAKAGGNHISNDAITAVDFLSCGIGRGLPDRQGGRLSPAPSCSAAHSMICAELRRVCPGDVVNIPAGVKHWHGAARASWFQHLAIEVPGEDTRTEWCEPVDGEHYASLS